MKTLRTLTVLFSVSLALSGFPSIHAAEGLRALPETAESIATVGGRIANLRDPSVVRLNPASLADISDTTFQFSFQAWHGKTDFTQSTGASDSMIVPWKYAGSLFIAHPLNDNLTAGLGISAPFGVSINWPRQGLFRYSTPFDSVLQTFAINPAIGFDLNDRISLGAGLDIYHSRLKLDQAYSWGLATGFPFPDGDMTFEGEGTGVGGYIGVNFKLSDTQRLSITGRLPVSVDYDGDFTIENVPAPVSGLFFEKSRFRSEIEHPGSIGVGYGVDISDKLTLGFDFEWTQNSTHDDLPLDIGRNQALLGGPVSLPLQWKDSISAGVGGSYQLREDLELRFGYLYSESPMRKTTYTPAVPADDRHIFSVGFGYDMDDRNRIDFGYSLIVMEDSKISGNINPAYNGTYDYDWNILTLSYTKKF